MTTFGLRPDDVVVDTRGNVLDGAAVKLYASQDDASNQTNLLGTAYTDPKGRWTFTTDLALVWARTANGLVWRVDSDEEDHGQMSGLLDDDHPQYALADGTRGAFLTQAQADALYDPLGAGGGGSGLPAGGTTGQVLEKLSAVDGDAGWATPAAGVTDHGALTGLADDDHTQYALADGTRGAFEAAGAVTAHEAAADPHPQYLTQTEADALYDPLGGAAGITSATVTTIWTGTQAAYDALTPSSDTLYFITG